VNDDIGRLATREYEVTLPDGTRAKLAFALCDLARENALARHARKRGAVAFGLLGFEGIVGAPAHPVLWVQTTSGMEMTVSDGDDQPAPELQRLIARHFALFYDDIKEVAPDLAVLLLRAEEGRSC
jgi:hypothetical protein